MATSRNYYIKEGPDGRVNTTFTISVSGYSGKLSNAIKNKQGKYTIKNPTTFNGLNLLVHDFVQRLNREIVTRGFSNYLKTVTKETAKKIADTSQNPKDKAPHKASYLRWKKVQEARGFSSNNKIYDHTGTFKTNLARFLLIELKKDFKRINNLETRLRNQESLTNIKFQSNFLGLVGRYSPATSQAFSKTHTLFKGFQFGYPRGHNVGTAETGVVGKTTNRLNKVMMIPVRAGSPIRYNPNNRTEEDFGFPFKSIPIAFISARKSRITTNKTLARPLITNSNLKEITSEAASKFIRQAIFKKEK